MDKDIIFGGDGSYLLGPNYLEAEAEEERGRKVFSSQVFNLFDLIGKVI